MTQKKIIIEKLNKERKIDNFYCVDNKITLRLGSYINMLKNEGWQFDRKYIDGTKNFQYTVIKKPELTLFQ